MENASKAIIMAGGVLIAVAVITLALYGFSKYKDYARTSEQILTVSQIESFNRFYEAYQTGAGQERTISGKKISFYKVRGIDYLNIYKKAIEDNMLDDSFIINEENSSLHSTISGDSSRFVGSPNYYYGFEYGSNGKITTIYLRETLP